VTIKETDPRYGDAVTDHLLDARQAAVMKNDGYGRSRELSLVLTKIDEALMWRRDDLEKKAADNG